MKDCGSLFALSKLSVNDDILPVEPTLVWIDTNEFLTLSNSVSVSQLQGTFPISVTTTTSSTIYIDPYTSACEQFSALAVNLGWPADQRTVLESIMKRESNCTPNAINRKDPFGGSRGLLQINGSWHKWLTAKGIITK